MRVRIVIAVCMCCFTLGRAAAQPVDTGEVTAEVRQTLERALGVSIEWDRQKEVDRFGRRAIRIVDASGEVYIDAETGLLVACGLNKRALPPERPWPEPMDGDRAYQKACEFLWSVGVPVKNFEWWHQKFCDHADGGSSWLITWTRWYLGVRMPCQILVNINALTEEVISYALVDVEVPPGLTLAVSADEAVRRAAVRAGFKRWRADRVEPAIWFDPAYPGPLALRWEIDLTSLESNPQYGSPVRVVINASTGRVISMAVPMGQSAPLAKAGHRRDKTPSAEDLKRAHWPPTVFTRRRAEQTRVR